MTLKMDVLPAPLRPMIPQRSPSATVKVMFLKSSSAPKEMPTLETERRVTLRSKKTGARARAISSWTAARSTDRCNVGQRLALELRHPGVWRRIASHHEQHWLLVLRAPEHLAQKSHGARRVGQRHEAGVV